MTRLSVKETERERERMFRVWELKRKCYYPFIFLAVNAALAVVDGILAAIAFSQLIRMHTRTQRLGWTRQKVLHLIIGSSNLGYVIYFTSTIAASCKEWVCWSSTCGFFLMACPTILFLTAFLLLLSFWVDLCHQANDDEEDEDYSFQEALLEKINSSFVNDQRNCYPFQFHIDKRQKCVVLVTFLIFVIMTVSAVLIWIGMGKNPIDSSVVARVYIDLFAIAILILDGALVFYGSHLYFRIKKVRSEEASSEIWKVIGLAVVCTVCFTSSALIALFTKIPVLYHWHPKAMHGDVSILTVLYYFMGSSLPSAFVLWIMREMPHKVTVKIHEDIFFISDRPEAEHNSERWVMATSVQHQTSKASPI